MAKAKTQYVCQACGSVAPKWSGQCGACGEWDTLSQELAPAATSKLAPKTKGRVLSLLPLQGEAKDYERLKTGNGEFDRVTGGGLVDGAALLIGGDPGIGKSTLLLQLMAQIATSGAPAVYISGEEGIAQIRMRASRLGVAESRLKLANATRLHDILATLEDVDPQTQMPTARVAVIDSIQTLYNDEIDSAPGTVTQVRACAHALIELAKRTGTVIIMVGHVTKDGAIAGPRVLEHMVDSVLYFEGDRGHSYRILRAVKNRFGATDEIGVFQMTDKGLEEVTNPSALFLEARQQDVAGSVVFAGMEGTRPLLVEIQALVAPAHYASPVRQTVGWDRNRLAMLLAVLEARCGVSLSTMDVYLNIAGGLRIHEPAADLAVAAAILSALKGTPVEQNTVFFGEVGLAGEIRSVSQTHQRLKEATKLGFQNAIMPKSKDTPSRSGLSKISALAESLN